jgi:hypothetical protein
MSSRAWTDVATGPEARSVRRWAQRVLPGVVLERLSLLTGMIVAILAFGAIHWTARVLPRDYECFHGCDSLPPKDLLDMIF